MFNTPIITTLRPSKAARRRHRKNNVVQAAEPAVFFTSRNKDQVFSHHHCVQTGTEKFTQCSVMGHSTSSRV